MGLVCPSLLIITAYCNRGRYNAKANACINLWGGLENSWAFFRPDEVNKVPIHFFLSCSVYRHPSLQSGVKIQSKYSEKTALALFLDVQE